MAESLKNGRKECGKKRNSSLRAISTTFPIQFSKDLYCKHIKTMGLLGKVLSVTLIPDIVR